MPSHRTIMKLQTCRKIYPHQQWQWLTQILPRLRMKEIYCHWRWGPVPPWPGKFIDTRLRILFSPVRYVYPIIIFAHIIWTGTKTWRITKDLAGNLQSAVAFFTNRGPLESLQLILVITTALVQNHRVVLAADFLQRRDRKIKRIEDGLRGQNKQRKCRIIKGFMLKTKFFYMHARMYGRYWVVPIKAKRHVTKFTYALLYRYQEFGNMFGRMECAINIYVISIIYWRRRCRWDSWMIQNSITFSLFIWGAYLFSLSLKYVYT